MEANLQINLGDLTEFRLYQQMHSRAAKLKRMTLAVLPPLVVFAAFLMLVQYGRAPWQYSRFSLLLVLMLPFYWWQLSNFTRRRLRKQISLELEANQSRSPLGEFRVNLAADGISVDRPSEPQRVIPWENIQRVLANGDYCYFYLDSENAIILPQRCFADHNYFKAFVKMAVTYHWAKESTTTSLWKQGTPQTPAIPCVSAPISSAPSSVIEFVDTTPPLKPKRA